MKSKKSDVINYFNGLMGECGYLLTTDSIYQYVGYAETEDELILDVYEGLPEEYWSTRHHIPKSKIIAHFRNRDDLIKLASLLRETFMLQEKLSQVRVINVVESGFDGSWEESEEGKKTLAKLKEKMKDKNFGSIDSICKPKKYLRWEDLKFTEVEQRIKVKLNDEDYTVVYFIIREYNSCSGHEYVGILKNDDLIIYSISSDDDFIYHYRQFFNNLHLEVVE